MKKIIYLTVLILFFSCGGKGVEGNVGQIISISAEENLEEPDVKVDPIKTITPGFIQKFFSVFKKDEEDRENKEN